MQDLVHYRVEAVFSDGILYISVRMEEKRGGQVGQDRNDGNQFVGQMDRPPASPDSIRGATSAARVHEARLKRAAHSNSPSLWQ